MGDIASVLRKAASGQLCVEITLYSFHQGLLCVSVVLKSFIKMAKTRNVSGFSFLNMFLAWNNFVYIWRHRAENTSLNTKCIPVPLWTFHTACSLLYNIVYVTWGALTAACVMGQSVEFSTSVVMSLLRKFPIRLNAASF